MSEPEYEHRSFRTISKSFGFSGKAGLNFFELSQVNKTSLFGNNVHQRALCSSDISIKFDGGIETWINKVFPLSMNKMYNKYTNPARGTLYFCKQKLWLGPGMER